MREATDNQLLQQRLITSDDEEYDVINNNDSSFKYGMETKSRRNNNTGRLGSREDVSELAYI